jgi:hypothetical protein
MDRNDWRMIVNGWKGIVIMLVFLVGLLERILRGICLFFLVLREFFLLKMKILNIKINSKI